MKITKLSIKNLLGVKGAFNAQSVQSYPDIYFAGIIDIPDDVKH